MEFTFKSISLGHIIKTVYLFLITYSNSIINNGSIQANGKRNNNSWGPPGGSTGGGSINIFYSDIINKGMVSAYGGESPYNWNSNWTVYGGAGGGRENVRPRFLSVRVQCPGRGGECAGL